MGLPLYNEGCTQNLRAGCCEARMGAYDSGYKDIVNIESKSWVLLASGGGCKSIHR